MEAREYPTARLSESTAPFEKSAFASDVLLLQDATSIPPIRTIDRIFNVLIVKNIVLNYDQV